MNKESKQSFRLTKHEQKKYNKQVKASKYKTLQRKAFEAV